MKKYISLLLAIIIIFTLTACQSNNGSSNNYKNSSDQATSQIEETTAQPTTQPATEPDYENTNFIAQPPEGKPKYKIEEIPLDEAAESSGFSLSDSEFLISRIYMENDYIVLNINYSNFNSPDCCSYNVIYDLDGNMVANASNIALDEGYDKSAQIRGVYGGYTVLCMSSDSAPLENVYALYNLETKEIKYINYDLAEIRNGLLIVGNDNPNEEYAYFYGALDLDLNEIIPVEYDELKIASPELFIAKKGKNYGIIDFDNTTIADFKYKSILNFAGIDYDNSTNCVSLLDFEKNINKYVVAIDNDGKVVLIDKGGKTTPINFDMSKTDISDGRIMAQYNNIIYLKNKNDNTISDLDGNLITDNATYFGALGGSGFINGYCNTKDSGGNSNLIDSRGNVVYSEKGKSEYEKVYISAVDQNGYFVSSVYSGNDYLFRNKILDLSGNIIYTSEEAEGSINPIGKGFFTKSINNGQSLFKVTAE